MLGGQTVIVQGPCFDQNDNTVCVFDGVEVMSVFVNSFKIVCVSPQLSRTGRVPFRLTVNGLPKGVATFSSCECKHGLDLLELLYGSFPKDLGACPPPPPSPQGNVDLSVRGDGHGCGLDVKLEAGFHPSSRGRGSFTPQQIQINN